jgi:hypothetical protein
MRLHSVLLFCFIAFTAASVSGQPSVTFEPESVTISGVTAGGDAIYLAAARIAHGYSRDMATETGWLSDSDGDGVTSIPLRRRLPLHSLWVAVDLPTGRSTVMFAHPPDAFHRSEKLNMGELRELVKEGDYLMFLLVRPGMGAWTLTIEDSDRHDGDGHSDLKVKLRIDDMEPIGSSPAAPRHLDKADVIFVVDPVDLRVFELRDEAVN